MERSVLVIDDNAEMLQRTYKAWKEQGYAQRCVRNGEEAVEELLSANDRDHDVRMIAVVEDFLHSRLIPMMKLIRCHSSLPVMILSSSRNVPAGAELFAIGADRYITIPETITEGILSGMALIRVSRRLANTEQQNGVTLFTHGFYLNHDWRRAFLRDQEVCLTHKEFDLLWLLANNHDRTLTYKSIYEHVWLNDYSVDVNQTIWTTVNRLRGKLEAASGTEIHIRNKRQTGYSLEN